MSLCGLQDSWGGGAGGTSAPGDVPMAVQNASGVGDPPTLYTITTTADPLTTVGLVRWDISELAKNLGQTSIIVPGQPPVIKYSGICSLQVAFRSTTSGTPPNIIRGASETGSYSISVGVLDGAPTSGDTDLLVAAESVSARNSPNDSAIYIHTVAAAIETTVPDKLYVYLAWYGLQAGKTINIGPASVYVIPCAPLTIIGDPIPPAGPIPPP
jgi:hypothetical protein